MSIGTSTIAAISTAQGQGGLGVIRISGPRAVEIGDRLFCGKRTISSLKGYEAAFGELRDMEGMVLDQCIALRFCAPKSYTGEDVVELSCHGGSFVMQRILRAVYEAGASPALPGEFTKRGFLNGKLDLTQAESVMELISATGERSREAAVAGQKGALFVKICTIREELVLIGGDLSAWADFPDDDIPQLDEKRLKTVLENSSAALNSLLGSFLQGKIYREGVRTAIVGKPNGGKSTLMNLLSGFQRSIVTELEGTTRDIVEEQVFLGDIPLMLSDTAGLRDTEDPVEKIGVLRARERLESAELILAVFDMSKPLEQEDMELIAAIQGRPCIAVLNKSDLPEKADLDMGKMGFSHIVYLSALTGEGLESLKQAVKAVLHMDNFVSGTESLYTERQRDCVSRALAAVEEAKYAFSSGLTLDAVTVMVEEAISALLELTGEKASEVLVDSVFSRFCVGK